MYTFNAWSCRAAKNKNILVSMIILILLILCVNFVQASDIVLSEQKDLYKLTLDLNKCFYSSSYNPLIDDLCLQKLSVISRRIDNLETNTTDFAVVQSITHSYLDLKAYPDENITRLIKKSIYETEIPNNNTTMSKQEYSKVLYENYRHRLNKIKDVLY